MSKVVTYAELLAWKEGGPVPTADSVIALFGSMSSQLEGLLSRIPPRMDEDLEPGVVRFKTIGQLRAEGAMEGEEGTDRSSVLKRVDEMLKKRREDRAGLETASSNPAP